MRVFIILVVFAVWVALCVCVSGVDSTTKHHAQQQQQQQQQYHSIPAYWINLDSAPQRKVWMEKHLKEYGFAYNQRVPALTKHTCNMIMVESTCLRVSLDDISILCSHVYALHTALTDVSPIAQKSKYFMVLEDDIKFNMVIDFNKLVEAAPRDFGMIQLMMSHKKHIQEAWYAYQADNRANLFSYRPRNSTVWSAQAILYNKDAIRSFVDKAVRLDRYGRLGFKLVNTFDYEKYSSYNVNGFRPSIASDCMFSDMFLYSVGQPAYILNVPIMTSNKLGLNSSYHQTHVLYHIHGFAKIQELQKELIVGSVPAPGFIDISRSKPRFQLSKTGSSSIDSTTSSKSSSDGKGGKESATVSAPSAASSSGTRGSTKISSSSSSSSSSSMSSSVDWEDVAAKNPVSSRVPDREK